ncbi:MULTISPECIES: hypothetical protein [Streptomyces]|uniref:hypothetical protein n=1 Tax=Streptomyces TaxID=1883 RepID=UPI00115FB676|nr:MULTISPECIES: hypothetical protein [unclassified Streptomyces]
MTGQNAVDDVPARNDPCLSGQAVEMPSSPAALVVRVRHALVQAGFHLVGEDDSRTPGLRVSEVSEGALVGWTASDGFAALASDQSGATSDGIRAVVQAAVAGLLVQLGHTVTEPTRGMGSLLVLAVEPEPTRQ